VIDWLNGRAKAYTSVDGDEEVVADWCTGNVGMTGTSYNGTLPLAAATTGVEGLKAIIPVSPNTSYYHYYRSHGLVRHPGGYMGEDVDVLYDFINSGYPEGREWCDCNVRDEILVAGADRLTGDLNEFWAGRNYANQLGDLKAAVLLAHGFNDWNVMPDHSVRIYEGLKAKGTPCQIYLHQGGHGGPPPADQMNRWFTRYVCGVENDVEKDARSWVVREGKSRKNPTAYAEYPHPEAEAVDVFPNGDGTGVGTLGGKRGKGVQVLVDDVAFKGGDLAKVGSSNHRLLFATPILKQDLHLSGYSELTIRLASSRPAANLSVWLVSLPWTSKGKINANLVTRGWADPQNQTSMRESEALTPGEYVELSFTLQPDDQVIPAGQQLGLMIFSSDREFTLWPKAGTELSVDLAGTSLSLPVVGGKAALKRATGR
jgi:X-Pro dipeptidyl-peptidase